MRKKMDAYAIGFDGPDEVLVRGTMDPSTAARYVLEHGWERLPGFEDDVGLCHRGTPAGPLTEDAKSRLAHWVYEVTRAPERVGYFRMNVQAPGGEYGWMLDYVDGPGYGHFQGVLFSG